MGTASSTRPTVAQLESARPARIWYGVAAAPAVWALQGSLAWFVTGRACADGNPAWGPLSGGVVRLVLIGITAAAIAAGLAGAVAALQAWRDASGKHDLRQAEGRALLDFLTAAGLLISGIFVIAIFWAGLPALMLPICEAAR